jgi:cytochrome oxidase assembly protein ShyY1
LSVKHDYRFVFSARWIRYAAFALVLVVVCLLLSNWQNHRRQSRDAQIANIEAHYGAAPGELSAVLPGSDSPLDPTAEWSHIRVTGTYDTAHTVVARNRSQDGSPGFYVVTPLRLDGAQTGHTLLVVRGFLPTKNTGGLPQASELPQPAPGRITVTGWLRPTQDGTKDDNPPGTLKAIDPRRLPGLSDPYWHAYAQLDREDPAADSALSPLAKPDTDPGSHLSYQLQWIAFGVMIVIALIYMAVRERKNREEAVRLSRHYGADAPDAQTGAAGGLQVIDKDALVSGARITQSGGRYGEAVLGGSSETRLHRRKRSADEEAEDAWYDSRP